MKLAISFAGIVLSPWLLAAEPAGAWVKVSADGTLTYSADERGNVIPDFSNCGFGGGGVILPTPGDVPVRETLQPNPGREDDGARIQAAIDRVSRVEPDSRGFRGTVLLKAGTYRIGGSIAIKIGGVVLRGEGQDRHKGTLLIAAGKSRRTLITVGAGGRERGPNGKSRKVTDAYVPVGARTLTLDSTEGLKPADHVLVHRPSTASWIHDLHMDKIPQRRDGGRVTQWTAGSKDLDFDRIITSIDGRRVTFDAPLTCALDAQYGGGSLRPYDGPERIRYVGIENLIGVSEFTGPEDRDEEHSWVFIRMTDVEHAWVRNITAEHFASSAVSLGPGAKWVTVQDSSCLDPVSQITGSRRYSFPMDDCQLCLVQRCHARNGRHDFVMGSLTPGPNVFLDCRAEKTHADAGPHHRWSTGTLYDNLVLPDGQLNIRDRGSMGSGHGWAGANQVAWNCTVKEMIVESPPTARNWAIGCVVEKHTGNGAWESIGKHVEPKSLYLAQLRARLGDQAVANVTGK